MTFTTKKAALTAAMSALTAVLTLISVPLPGGGYYNFGDVAIFVCSLSLGPALGAVCGGLGGAIGDLILGYTFYAPFTLVIKALEGFIAGSLFAICKKTVLKNKRTIKNVIFGSLTNLAGGIVMAAGYFLAEGLLLAEGRWQGGIVNLPWNILQGSVSSVVAAVILFACRLDTLICKVSGAPRETADKGDKGDKNSVDENKDNTAAENSNNTDDKNSINKNAALK